MLNILTKYSVHIMHVGTMDNRGTQALLLSDVAAIKDIVGAETPISISTADVKGVKKLGIGTESVVSPFLDIPFQKVDSMAMRFGFNRGSLKYKAFALESFFIMIIQAILSAFSVGLLKVGIKALYRSEAFKLLTESDLVVSCSGENFKETASALPLNFLWLVSWWSMLISRTWEILIAKSLGKTVVMFPNSVGPFRTLVGKFLTITALKNCDFVLVREPISYDIVKSLGIRSNIILTADTALLYSLSTKPFLINSSGIRIGVSPGIYGNSLSEKEINRYILAHAQALDSCIEKYGLRVFFLPHFVMGFSHDDMQMCVRIFSEMKYKENAEIIYEPFVAEFKSILDKMNMVISSKMHPAILAASGYVPVLCVFYDHKQTGFFKLLNMTDCIMEIRSVTRETLFNKIEYVWQNRVTISDSLSMQIPILQADVRLAIEKAVSPFLATRLSDVR